MVEFGGQIQSENPEVGFALLARLQSRPTPLFNGTRGADEAEVSDVIKTESAQRWSTIELIRKSEFYYQSSVDGLDNGSDAFGG